MRSFLLTLEPRFYSFSLFFSSNAHCTFLFFQMIRTVASKIEELKILQNSKIEEESFIDAELLDDQIKKLKREVSFIKYRISDVNTNNLSVIYMLLIFFAAKI